MRVSVFLASSLKRVTKSFRSWLSWKACLPSIPRIITWCRVPGASTLAWRGIASFYQKPLKCKVQKFHYVPFSTSPFYRNQWRVRKVFHISERSNSDICENLFHFSFLEINENFRKTLIYLEVTLIYNVWYWKCIFQIEFGDKLTNGCVQSWRK